MTQEERDETIEMIYGCLDSIITDVDRMTSGNFMHNKNSIKFSAQIAINSLKKLGI